MEVSDTEITAENSARLVRASIGYAGLELDEVEKRTGIKRATLRNYTSRTRPVRAPLEKRLLIARECGVPRWFMELGFQAADAHHVAPAESADATIENLVLLTREAHQRIDSLQALLRAWMGGSSSERNHPVHHGLGAGKTAAAIESTRALKQAAVGPPADADASTPAAPEARDEAGAKPEADQAPPAGRRRTAR